MAALKSEDIHSDDKSMGFFYWAIVLFGVEDRNRFFCHNLPWNQSLVLNIDFAAQFVLYRCMSSLINSLFDQP